MLTFFLFCVYFACFIIFTRLRVLPSGADFLGDGKNGEECRGENQSPLFPFFKGQNPLFLARLEKSVIRKADWGHSVPDIPQLNHASRLQRDRDHNVWLEITETLDPPFSGLPFPVIALPSEQCYSTLFLLFVFRLD